jgi:type II secretory pathway component PulM
MIAPWFFAMIGLFLALVIPYRVMWAIDRNNEIRRKIDEERRMAAAQARNKKLKEEAMKYDSMV